MSDVFGYGQWQPSNSASDYAKHEFQITQILGRVRTVCLVKVTAVKNAGQDEPVGFVDVQPITNMQDGAGNSQQHGTLHGLPYFRVQGGTNAVIVDPVVGDIGVAAIADRDISSNKANKGMANPGSFRRFDMADGIYFGGILNGAPKQYITFTSNGIQMVDANGNEITMSPQGTNIADSNGNIIAMVSGGINITAQTLTVNGQVVGTMDGVFSGVSAKTHVHTGVTAGGSDTGPPVP